MVEEEEVMGGTERFGARDTGFPSSIVVVAGGVLLSSGNIWEYSAKRGGSKSRCPPPHPRPAFFSTPFLPSKDAAHPQPGGEIGEA